ncbi:hypothetical protein Ahy_B08g089895 isoform B [Arachis hypogaea]|uniref:Uncharacterized protein n=1 Tax=Arachis hypogaea TaxID=3818 RepID=A0A444XZ10_ARAHY|nr:hypothetical protein Ahy_B08g089895 isoform B [Arachis hypogaea]
MTLLNPDSESIIRSGTTFPVILFSWNLLSVTKNSNRGGYNHKKDLSLEFSLKKRKKKRKIRKRMTNLANRGKRAYNGGDWR